jgi:hypothetical protein
MDGRSVRIAGAMAKAGVGLLALPLADLPPVVHAQVLCDGVQPELALQLGSVHVDEQVRGLLAWAAALPDRVVVGLEQQDSIRLEVRGSVDGVSVAVWTYLRGEHLVDTGGFLGLAVDGESHVLPLGALRALAQHREAVSTGA